MEQVHYRWRFVWPIGILLGLFFFSGNAHAGDFRHGHLAWKATGTSRVEFTFTASFWRSIFEGSGTDGSPIQGDIIQDDDFTLCFGDGECIVGLAFTITSFSQEENWIMGVAGVKPGDKVIEHIYAQHGEFVAFSESCCRISNVTSPNAHINNPHGGYRLETTVLLLPP